MKAAPYFRPGTGSETAEMVRFIDAERGEYGGEPICTVVEFPPSASLVTDAFSRAIVCWQVGDTLAAELALDALEMACGHVGRN